MTITCHPFHVIVACLDPMGSWEWMSGLTWAWVILILSLFLFRFFSWAFENSILHGDQLVSAGSSNCEISKMLFAVYHLRFVMEKNKKKRKYMTPHIRVIEPIQTIPFSAGLVTMLLAQRIYCIVELCYHK